MSNWNNNQNGEEDLMSEPFSSPPVVWRGDMRGSLQSSLRASLRSSLRSSVRSLDQEDDQQDQSNVQGGMVAHEVIASQQLQIQMLQTQVEALSMQIAQMASAQRNTTEQMDYSPFLFNAAVEKESILKATLKSKSDKNTKVQVPEEELLIVDDTPVNPAQRLSIPLFYTKEAENEAEELEKDAEEEEEENIHEEEEEELFPSPSRPQRVPLYDVDVPRIQYEEYEEGDDDTDIDDTSSASASSRHGGSGMQFAVGGVGKRASYSEYDSMVSGADISCYQEGPTDARIEAKYMLSGERTAVLRGERFRPKTATSESMEGQISYVENNSEGDKIDEDEGIKKTMFLNRDKLQNQIKFK